MDSSITHIRPRFKFDVPLKQAEVMKRINNILKDTPAHINGYIVDDHVIIDIVGEKVHYWSPQLNFRVEEDEFAPENTIISGLIGPKPAVWTMFMFVYFAIGILGFFISCFGVPKLMSGEFSPLVLAFPIAILLMLTAYQAGKFGEKLGADQVEMLKDIVRKAISTSDQAGH